MTSTRRRSSIALLVICLVFLVTLTSHFSELRAQFGVNFVKQVPVESSSESAFVKDSYVDSSGNSYVVGQGTGAPAPYTFAASSRSIFIQKYDLNGTLQYNLVFSTTNSSETNPTGAVLLLVDSIVSDDEENAYVTGSFNFKLEIPGFGVLFSEFTHATYLCKIDPNGTVVWVSLIQVEDRGYQEPQDITVDGDGNVYVQGFFILNIIFNGSFVLNTSSDSLFSNWVAKYSNSGEFIWAFGGNGTSQIDQMATNSKGVSCMAGIYQVSVSYTGLGDIEFEATSPNYGNVTPFSAFVVQFDTNGTIEYLFNISSNFYAFPVAVSIGEDDKCRIVGNYWGSFQIDQPNNSSITREEVDGATIFFLTLTPDGELDELLFSEGGIDTGGPVSTDMSCDRNGSCWLTGQFYSSFNFSSNLYLNDSVNGQIFISRRVNETGEIDFNLQSLNQWATPEAITVDKQGKHVTTSGNFISGFEIAGVVLSRPGGSNNLFQNYYLVSIVEGNGTTNVSSVSNDNIPETNFPVPVDLGPNCPPSPPCVNNTQCCNGTCSDPSLFFCDTNFVLQENPPDWEKRIPWPFCFGVNCPVGTACCQGACFNTTIAHCPHGRQICPLGEDACSNVCFSPSEFTCNSTGNLVPLNQSMMRY